MLSGWAQFFIGIGEGEKGAEEDGLGGGMVGLCFPCTIVCPFRVFCSQKKYIFICSFSLDIWLDCGILYIELRERNKRKP